MYRSESQFTHPKSFEYFATSRELYGKLTKDYQLTSICTLTRITSKFASQDAVAFFTNLVSKIENWQ